MRDLVLFGLIMGGALTFAYFLPDLFGIDYQMAGGIMFYLVLVGMGVIVVRRFTRWRSARKQKQFA